MIASSALDSAEPAPASSAVSARRASPPAMRSRCASASPSSVTAPPRPRSSAERAAHHAADVVVGERFEGEQQRAGQQRGDHREVRVLRGGGDQGDPAVLHRGQQRVLLRLAEAVDLVEEEHGLAAVAAGLALGALDDRADLLDAGGDRRQLDEALVGRLAHHVREGGLAGAGRAPQDHRGRAGRTAAALPHQPAQRRAGAAAGAAGRRPRPGCAGASARRAGCCWGRVPGGPPPPR